MKKRSRLVSFLACLLSIGMLLLVFGCDSGSSSSSSGGCDPTPTPGPTPVPTPGDSSCLDGITNFTSAGPFRYSTKTSGNVKMWVPAIPSGCKVPVVHYANGTGATCNTYAAMHQRLASHGFLSVCYESTDTGQGTQAITAINTAVSQNPTIADGTKLGFSGHSQGGGGAIMGVYRAEQTWGTSRTYAGHAIEPASGFGDSPSNWESLYGQIKSPIFMFNGSSDALVSESWVRQAFNALSDSVEKVWYEAVGASHMTPLPTDYANQSHITWFRWKLLGDSAACQAFKNLPNSRDWNLQDQENVKPCN